MQSNYKFHWLHPKIETRATDICGDGLFTSHKIRAGERLLVFGGYVLTVEEESLLPGKMGDNGVQIAKDLVICATRPDDWGGENFLNHSCDPNAGFRGQIVVVAMRDIRKHEQISIDYAMVLHRPPRGPAYRMKCLCGAANCRGLVTDNDWKIEALQVKYRGWFQPYLQAEIDRPHAALPVAASSKQQAASSKQQATNPDRHPLYQEEVARAAKA